MAADIVPAQNASLACIDISSAAVHSVMERLPQVQGIVADAAALPLTENCIDIAVSQFGIEYAGIEAIAGLLHAIKPGGEIALLIHHKSGAIYRECADNHAALREVQAIGFVDSAIEMFDKAFAVLAGGARTEYEQASQKLIPGFRAIEKVMQRYGKRVAGDTVRRLCLDVDHIHAHLHRYQKEEVLGWLQRTAVELESYAGRMMSMCEAAIDKSDLRRLVDHIKNRGFSVDVAEPLEAENLQLPLAWSLVASNS